MLSQAWREAGGGGDGGRVGGVPQLGGWGWGVGPQPPARRGGVDALGKVGRGGGGGGGRVGWRGGVALMDGGGWGLFSLVDSDWGEPSSLLGTL